jgi:hypothetical protein
MAKKRYEAEYVMNLNKTMVTLQKAQKQAELSAARFMQFAQAHNKKYEEVGRKNE